MNGGSSVLAFAEGSGAALTEELIARIFLSLAIIIVVARLAGAAFRKLHQPAVVGEIVAGILLGPSLLGLIDEDLPARLFPLDARPYLAVVANLGLIIFMFIVGLELDMGLIRGKARLAAVTSVSSVLLPFSLGIAASTVLHGAFGEVDGAEIEWAHFALFLGAAMSVTAFPVLARILTERRMHRTRLGALTLACAAVDDVLAWSLLAAVLAVVGESHLEPHWVMALALAFMATLVVVVRPLLERLVARYQAVGRLTPDLLAAILVGVLVSSWLTSEIGIHAIFGAFSFGAVFPREGAHQLLHELLERLEQVTVLLLLPVFFVITGLSVDVTGLGVDGLGYLALVLAVACTGKFVGATIGARSQGVPARQAMAVGVLMNTRGLTELVILAVGREAGVLNDEMFTILVVMAVATTVITEPVLRLLYPDELVDREIAEAERLGSEEAAAFRVLVGTPQGGPGEALATIAAELTHGEDPREVALVQFGDARDDLEVGGGIEALAASLEDLHALESAVEALGVPVFARSRTTDDPGRLLGLLADESVADVVLVPDEPGYTPPGGTLAPAAPTGHLVLPPDATVDGPVEAVVDGGAADRHVIALGLRLAGARGQALRLRRDGRVGRRTQAVVDSLGEVGAVADAGPTSGLVLRGGAPSRSEPASATLWVVPGRDDGADGLRALIDRIRATSTTTGA